MAIVPRFTRSGQRGRRRRRWLPALALALPTPSPAAMIARPAAETRQQAETCLAQAVAFEAGAEPEEGRVAVAQVVLNRLHDPAYPKSVCGVVFQGSDRHTGCQFTFTCDGSLERRRPANWAAAVRIARGVLDGTLASAIGAAEHYHAFYVRPGWAAQLTRVARIGAHIFYAGRAAGAAPSALPAPAAPQPAGFSAWGIEMAVLRPGRGGVAVVAPPSPSPAPETGDRAFP